MVLEERALGVNTLVAQQLAEGRLGREAVVYRATLEQLIRTAANREQLEQRGREREEFYRSVLAERTQDMGARLFHPMRRKQEQAQAERDRLQEEFEQHVMAREAAEDARRRAFEEQQETEAAARMEKADHRDRQARFVTLRAEAMEAERVLEECRRQDDIAHRRAEAVARLHEDRARSVEARRMREESAQRYMQAHQDEEGRRLQDKAVQFDEKIDRINRMEAKRDEVLQDNDRLRGRVYVTRLKIQDLLQQASTAKSTEAEELRTRLSELLTDLPMTPRSAGGPGPVSPARRGGSPLRRAVQTPRSRTA